MNKLPRWKRELVWVIGFLAGVAIYLAISLVLFVVWNGVFPDASEITFPQSAILWLLIRQWIKDINYE